MAIAIRNGVVGSGTSTLNFMHSDQLGSVTALTNTSGGLVSGSISRFYPFGGYRTTPTTNPGTTDQGYTGHKHNDSIDLIYMNARYYVPSIGRFASADTIVPNPTNPQDFNRYSYVRNNPTNFIDPSGHKYVYEDGDTYCWPCEVPPNFGSGIELEVEWIENANAVYNEIMNSDYYFEYFDLLYDIYGNEVDFVSQLLQAYTQLAGGLVSSEAEFFDFLGKTLAALGSVVDAIDLVARLLAIQAAYNADPASFSQMLLDYLFTRATISFEASIYLAGGSLVFPWIGMADILITWKNVVQNDNGLDPNEWLAKEVTNAMFYEAMTVDENYEIVYAYEENRSYWPFGAYRIFTDLLLD
jgi:RHS repeat-associated protein